MDINEKENLFKHFLHESNKIIDLLEQEEYELVNKALENRETIIRRINQVNQLTLGEQVHYEIQERLNPLFLELMDKEQVIQIALEERRNFFSEQLQMIQAAKKLNRSYNLTQANNDGYFIDKAIKPK